MAERVRRLPRPGRGAPSAFDADAGQQPGEAEEDRRLDDDRVPAIAQLRAELVQDDRQTRPDLGGQGGDLLAGRNRAPDRLALAYPQPLGERAPRLDQTLHDGAQLASGFIEVLGELQRRGEIVTHRLLDAPEVVEHPCAGLQHGVRGAAGAGLGPGLLPASDLLDDLGEGAIEDVGLVPDLVLERVESALQRAPSRQLALDLDARGRSGQQGLRPLDGRRRRGPQLRELRRGLLELRRGPLRADLGEPLLERLRRGRDLADGRSGRSRRLGRSRGLVCGRGDTRREAESQGHRQHEYGTDAREACGRLLAASEARHGRAPAKSHGHERRVAFPRS